MQTKTYLRAHVLLPCLALLVVSGAAQAERADRTRPVNLLAGTFEHDEVKGESVASSGVVFTKGSILVRADKAVVREDAQGYQHAHLTALPGQRVFFSQRRDGPDDESVQAEAQVIAYDGRADVVTLIGQGRLLQFRAGILVGELTGERIRHDGVKGRLTADNQEAAGEAGQPRLIRLMLVPRAAASGVQTP